MLPCRRFWSGHHSRSDPRKDASKDAASETEAEEKLDKALRELGLTTPQYATLSALEESPGLSGAALARHSFVTPPTMNGIVTNLETTGLVVRRSHPKHGRVLQAYLTEEGVGLVVQAHRVVEAIEERILSARARKSDAGLWMGCVVSRARRRPDRRRWPPTCGQNKGAPRSGSPCVAHAASGFSCWPLGWRVPLP